MHENVVCAIVLFVCAIVSKKKVEKKNDYLLLTFYANES